LPIYPKFGYHLRHDGDERKRDALPISSLIPVYRFGLMGSTPSRPHRCAMAMPRSPASSPGTRSP